MPRGMVVPLLLALAVLPLPALAPPAHGLSNSNASIALHLAAVTSKNQCLPAPPSCSNIVTRGDLAPNFYYAYLLVTNVDPVAGVAGVQCGIRYNPLPQQGVDVFSFNLCATIYFSSTGFPNSGGGTLITWNSTNKCQRSEPGGPGTGAVAVAGYFYVGAYTPDRMDVTTRPVDGWAKIADCQSNEYPLEGPTVHHTPYPLGSATFTAGATLSGYNPCDGTGGPPAGDCVIQGPADVIEGQAGLHYAVTDITPADGIHWSISGNGIITSSLTDTAVTVSATTPGAFFLSVASDNNGITCQRAIAVNPVPCTFTGPDNVPSHQVNLEYAATTQVPGTVYAWSISGQGVLTGPTDGPSVHVTAGAVGTFTLGLEVTRSGLSHTCGATFHVLDSGQCPATQADAKLLIHLQPTTTPADCGPAGARTCADVVTAGALYPTTYFGYLLVAHASAFAGVAGVECGLHYDDAPHSGVDIYSWSLCATLEFHTADWPASGSGNRITWDPASKCQRSEPGGAGTGVTADAGYFYLAAYSPDQLALRPHPLTGEAKLADCTACESVIARTADGLFPGLGSANFTAGGNSEGYNPCGSVVPVMKTTWSSIKAYFKGDTPQK